MEFGLAPFILEDIKNILRDFSQVETASIFGSHATASFKNESDIDIAIHAPLMERGEFTRMSFEIHELPIVFKINLIHVDHLENQNMKLKIQQEEKQFYRKEN